MWSNDLITWRIPLYQPASTYASGYKGGSDPNWPRDNVPGDSRSYLSFWAPAAGNTGACCCDTYSNTQASDGAACGGNWADPADLFIVRPLSTRL